MPLSRSFLPAVAALTVAGLLGSLALFSGDEKGFVPPGPKERLQAIGVTSDLEEPLRRALRPDASFFAPLASPGPSDWLAQHPESGQTYQEFVDSRPLRPTKERRKIYLLPLGEFQGDRRPELELLREHAAAYFGLEATLLGRLSLEDAELTSRRHGGRRQILTGDILRLLRQKLPRDAFCLVGVTLEDLYPGPGWNFVFGQASLRQRVGVYSFARYDPTFHGERPRKGDRRKILRRSLRVLVHETAHIFGLRHCVYYRCVVNGSNHLKESDSQPLHLCPVCLRKLQSSCGFDVAARYRSLERFYRKAGFVKPADWIRRRLEVVTGRKP